jgi:hypothetical protein
MRREHTELLLFRLFLQSLLIFVVAHTGFPVTLILVGPGELGTVHFLVGAQGVIHDLVRTTGQNGNTKGKEYGNGNLHGNSIPSGVNF